MAGTDTGREGEVELATARAAETLASGVRSSVQNNATAYGFSISITGAFGLVSSTHANAASAMQVLAFAAAAALSFSVVELASSRLFQRVSGTDDSRVLFMSGAVDGLSVVASIGAAVGLSRIPGLVAWPATAAGTVLVFLLVGGIDVLIARQMARRTSD